MLKTIITTLLLCLTLSVSAATPNDTIAVNQNDISKWVETEVVNTKGAKTKKYFCIYKDQLLTTSKTVYEKVELCKKFGAKCALILIGKKVNGKFVPKRVALN